jgi:CTP:phosphocholine cytidylyltransferase-like protein
MGEFSAVVYTTGRTGSQLIVNNICQHYGVKSWSYRDTEFTHGVVHSHSPVYVPPSDNFIAILSKRRNLFNSILSTIIAKHTNEFTIYTNKEIISFTVDINEFKNCYFFQKAFYHAVDLSKFNKVVEVYYEDLISDSDCLLTDFSIKLDNSLSSKSPYNYYDIVTNIDELKDVFDLLEKTPLSDSEIDQYKLSVTADLDAINAGQ